MWRGVGLRSLGGEMNAGSIAQEVLSLFKQVLAALRKHHEELHWRDSQQV